MRTLADNTRRAGRGVLAATLSYALLAAPIAHAQPSSEEGPTEADLAPNVAQAAGDPDGDGLLDEVDRCPSEAGSIEQHGCPARTIEDADDDGVVGSADECPDVAGAVDARGCLSAPEPTLHPQARLDFDGAVALGRAGSLEEAAQRISSALEREPRWAAAYRLRAGFWSGLADKYEPASGFLQAQRNDLEVYLRNDPTAPDRAQILTALGALSQRIEKTRRKEERADQRGLSMLIGGGTIAGTAFLVGGVPLLATIGKEHQPLFHEVVGSIFGGLMAVALPLMIAGGVERRRSKKRKAAYARLFPAPPPK